MKPFSTILVSSLLALAGTAISHAQLLDVTSSGTAIFGLNETGSYGTTGQAYIHAGSLANLTDETGSTPNLTTHADSYYASNDHVGLPDPPALPTYDSSYVGFTFASPTTQAISALTVNFNFFGNGGWFGKNGTAPGTGQTVGSDLIEPTLQYTLDGTTWLTLADTSNYITVLQNAGGSDNVSGDTVTFTVTTPIAGLEGIRVIGTNGGTTGMGSGFIGVADERVFTGSAPEPSTYAMLLSGLALLGFRLRRKASSLL